MYLYHSVRLPRVTDLATTTAQTDLSLPMPNCTKVVNRILIQLTKHLSFQFHNNEHELFALISQLFVGILGNDSNSIN